MKRILAAIRAVLAGMAVFARRRCTAAGRWVLERVAAVGATPMPPVPEMDDEVAQVPVADQRADTVRRAAMLLAAGDRDDRVFGLLGDEDFAWLAGLDRATLIQVSYASNDKLQAHFTDQRVIAGVEPARRELIDDYDAAMALVRRRDEQKDEEMDWSVGIPGPTPGMGM